LAGTITKGFCPSKGCKKRKSYAEALKSHFGTTYINHIKITEIIQDKKNKQTNKDKMSNYTMIVPTMSASQSK